MGPIGGMALVVKAWGPLSKSLTQWTLDLLLLVNPLALVYFTRCRTCYFNITRHYHSSSNPHNENTVGNENLKQTMKTENKP
jgi:hypothetical protein